MHTERKPWIAPYKCLILNLKGFKNSFIQDSKFVAFSSQGSEAMIMLEWFTPLGNVCKLVLLLFFSTFLSVSNSIMITCALRMKAYRCKYLFKVIYCKLIISVYKKLPGISLCRWWLYFKMWCIFVIFFFVSKELSKEIRFTSKYVTCSCFYFFFLFLIDLFNIILSSFYIFIFVMLLSVRQNMKDYKENSSFSSSIHLLA